MRLFMEHGFEATTLDAIAEAAGIARRTFFHYFENKEALLFAYEDEAEESFRAALARLPDDMPPFESMCAAMLTMVSSFGTDEARAIDRLMRSNEALQARKQGNYGRQEQFLFAALQEKWPDPLKHLRLRMVAMVGMGAMRVAAEAWSTEITSRPLQPYLEERFAILRDLLA
jgi:AcrR family transcriptional regulator